MPSNRDKHPTYAQPAVSAASMRAPLKGEIHAIAVTTTSRRFIVPDAWKGHFVRFQADGGDLYIQVSTGTDAAVDKDARSTEGGTPITAITLTAAATACYRVPIDGERDSPFPSDAATFALAGSATCAARTHLAES